MVRDRKTSSSVASRRCMSIAVDAGVVERAHDVDAATCRRRSGAVTMSARCRSTRSFVGERRSAALGRGGGRSSAATLTSIRSSPMRAFSSSGRAGGDGSAVVEHDDVVGEAVGLFEVLRGEDDRGPVAHELAQHVPQVVAAARVEPGGRLVEEQHRRARPPGWRRGRAGGACRPRTSSRAGRRRRRGRAARAARRPGVRATALGEVVAGGRPARGCGGPSAARRRWRPARRRRCGRGRRRRRRPRRGRRPARCRSVGRRAW